MAGAFRDALLERCPEGAVDGVYVKGSAYRPWESAVDYVPGVSDVDVHVRMRPEARHPRRSIGLALEVGDRALDIFTAAHPEPLHVPRPQLVFLDELEAMPGYLPSPAESVTTLFGTRYAGAAADAYRDTRDADLARFDVDRLFVLEELPGKVVDRPGRALWNVIERLTWRVGPTGPRVLTQLGADPFTVWAMNRSAIVKELAERGGLDVAAAYVDYYGAGWRGFEDGFADSGPAQDAIRAATRLFVAADSLIESTR